MSFLAKILAGKPGIIYWLTAASSIVFLIIFITIRIKIRDTENNILEKTKQFSKATYKLERLKKKLDSLNVLSRYTDPVMKQSIPDSGKTISTVKPVMRKTVVAKHKDSVIDQKTAAPVPRDPFRWTAYKTVHTDDIQLTRNITIDEIQLLLVIGNHEEYGDLLGITDYKLSFRQINPHQANSKEHIATFRVYKATVENNRTIDCIFKENLHEYDYKSRERSVTLKGTINDDGSITGTMEWVDQSDKAFSQQIKIPVTFKTISSGTHK